MIVGRAKVKTIESEREANGIEEAWGMGRRVLGEGGRKRRE